MRKHPMKILSTLRHRQTLRVCVIHKYGLYIRRDIGLAPLKIPPNFMYIYEKTPNEAT